MALQKNKIEIFINGEKLSFFLQPEEMSLFEKAEDLINKRINEFSQRPESRNMSPTLFLKAIILNLAVDLLRREELREKTEDKIKELNSQIEDINSQIDNYLSSKAA